LEPPGLPESAKKKTLSVGSRSNPSAPGLLVIEKGLKPEGCYRRRAKLQLWPVGNKLGWEAAAGVKEQVLSHVVLTSAVVNCH